MKEYKPGQLITIHGHVYRILKRIRISDHLMVNGKLIPIYESMPCREICAFKRNSHICRKYCLSSAYHRHIPNNCYFKLVK